MRGRGITGMITGGSKMLQGYLDARKIAQKLRPTAVFSTGGYIAVAGMLCGTVSRKSIVLIVRR